MSDTQDSIENDERMPYVDVDLEYSDDESSTSPLYSANGSPCSGFNLSPSTHRKTLVIDEIEWKHFNRNTNSEMMQHISTLTSGTSNDLQKNRGTACSCCLSYIQHTGTKKNDRNLIQTCNHTPEQKSYFESVIENLWSGKESKTNSTEHANLVIAKASLEYQIKSVVMESWIEKKGSGLDLFGNTSWKNRWCQLVLASIPGYDVDVPILLVSWHYSMPLPSTIIVLDMKLAIAKHSDDTSRFCFDVVAEDRSFSTSTTTTSINMARTFALSSLEECHGWISKINSATKEFQKSRKMHRMKSEPLPPISPTQKKSRQSPNVNLDGLSLCFDSSDIR